MGIEYNRVNVINYLEEIENLDKHAIDYWQGCVGMWTREGDVLVEGSNESIGMLLKVLLDELFVLGSVKVTVEDFDVVKGLEGRLRGMGVYVRIKKMSYQKYYYGLRLFSWKLVLEGYDKSVWGLIDLIGE